MGKRIMSMLLALCLCVTFLSACGGGSGKTTGTQTPATDSLQSGKSSNGLDESGDEVSNNGETDAPNSLDSSFAGADVGVTVDSLGAYTIGIKSDGTVIVSGDEQFGRCKQENVDDWCDIVSVAASENYAVGLKSNGTVVSTHDRYFDPDKWHNVVGIDAGLNHTVGVRDDGTVVVGGRQEYTEELFNVDNWSDIIAASAGTGHTVGLKSDGTVVAALINQDSESLDCGQCNVDDWTDIVAISAGNLHTVGLKSDGTVVATGIETYGMCDVGSWTDIVAISAGVNHTVGLKSDGTVVAVGHTGAEKDGENGEYAVEHWTDVIAISGGTSHTVGLKSDGTVLTTNSFYGDVSGWHDIKMPNK